MTAWRMSFTVIILLSYLVKPSFNPGFPVLVKVSIRNDIVVLDHLCTYIEKDRHDIISL